VAGNPISPIAANNAASVVNPTSHILTDSLGHTVAGRPFCESVAAKPQSTGGKAPPAPRLSCWDWATLSPAIITPSPKYYPWIP